MRAPSSFVALAFIFCLSCAKKESKEDDLQFRYYNLEKVGWKSKTFSQKVDGISFTATEVPIQYYLLKQIGKQNLAEVDSIYNENKQERIVEFTITHQDEENLMDKKFTGMSDADAIKYMSFGLDKDFQLVTDRGDTIQCNGVNYERNFKVAPFLRFLVFFSGVPPESEIQLLYDDHLFGKGKLKYRFVNNKEILL